MWKRRRKGAKERRGDQGNCKFYTFEANASGLHRIARARADFHVHAFDIKMALHSYLKRFELMIKD